MSNVLPLFFLCWVLIDPTLVFHFQQDDHLSLLDAVAHVKIGIYPFPTCITGYLCVVT
jgi:hypothetical protein